MDCALFAGIGRAEREEMLRCLDARRAKMVRGQALLEAGGPVREISVVLRGAVQVRSTDFFGNQTILAQLEPGDLFGEAFVCAGLSRSPVEAVCQQDGEVLLLDYGRILGACPRACAGHRRLVENMVAVLAQKNLTLMRKTRILSRRTTREKLLAYLSECAREAGGGQFDIPFTRQELADYLCVDRSAMTVALMALKREGLVELNGRTARIPAKNSERRDLHGI